MSTPSEDEEQEEIRDGGWLDTLLQFGVYMLPFGLVAVIGMLIVNTIFSALLINRQIKSGSKKSPDDSGESR